MDCLTLETFSASNSPSTDISPDATVESVTFALSLALPVVDDVFPDEPVELAPSVRGLTPPTGLSEGLPIFMMYSLFPVDTEWSHPRYRRGPDRL